MDKTRDIARVTPLRPVKGTPRRRTPTPSPRSGPVITTRVRPEVMAAARRAMRPGERLVVVSETEVRLVPAGG